MDRIDTMNATTWYDRLAWIYDRTTLEDQPYRKERQMLISALRPGDGHVVVDLLCGTGLNVPYIADRIGTSGRYIGIDGSEGMIEEAREKVKGSQLPLSRANFYCADVTTNENVRRVQEIIRAAEADRVLCTLGLTCLPNWDAFAESVWTAMSDGARFGIMDLYSEEKTTATRILDWLAASDIHQPVWTALTSRAPEAEVTRLPYRFLPSILRAEIIIATGEVAGARSTQDVGSAGG